MEKNIDQKQNYQKAIKALKDAIKDNLKKNKSIKTNTMRKFLILSGLVVLVTFNLFAQAAKDSTDILLKCVELNELQQFYPTETDGSLKPICIMQYPVSFSSEIELIYKGKKALFLTRPIVYEKNIKAFFLIHVIEITGDKATVTFEFDYYLNSILNIIKSTAVLQKNDNTWSISETINDSKL